MIRFLFRICMISLSVFLLHLTALAIYAQLPHRVPSAEGISTIIVLGAGRGAGGVGIGPRSLARAQTASEYAIAEGPFETMVFSGGGEPSMAQLMSDALGQHARPGVIHLEVHSFSTLQNALFSVRFVDVNQPIILVTNPWHMPRARLSFRAMGYSETHALMAPPQASLRMLVREVAATWFNAGRFVVWKALRWSGVEADHLLA